MKVPPVERGLGTDPGTDPRRGPAGPAGGSSSGGSLDLLVVGGGPVGLFAGLHARMRGLSVRVVERRSEPRTHSRAIGIHPPALSLLSRLPAPPGPDGHPVAPSMAHAMVARGIRVRRGHALGDGGRRLGSLDFGTLDGPWPFVLTLPQAETEQLLAQALGPDLQVGVHIEPSAVVDRSELPGRPRWILGADGRHSPIREALGLPFPGRGYPHRYLMADLEGPGARCPGVGADEAAIGLTRGGLVESFPLRPGVRRWVVERSPAGDDPVGGRQGAPEDGPEVPPPPGDGSPPPLDELLLAVEERLGIDLGGGRCLMTSSFGAERRRAPRIHSGGVFLVGDAAHVVSPIGGQGMNLGWIHAALVVDLLAGIRRGGVEEDRAVEVLEGQVARGHRIAGRRAEFNMRLGHRIPAGPAGVLRPMSGMLHTLRTAALRALLAPTFQRRLARTFAMGGLEPGGVPGGGLPEAPRQPSPPTPGA